MQKLPPCLLSFSSETDEDRRQGDRNGQSSRTEFKDEEETVTTKSVQIVQATETTATRKRGTPSKVIDLGAAAHYTGDKAINTNKVIKTLRNCTGPNTNVNPSPNFTPRRDTLEEASSLTI